MAVTITIEKKEKVAFIRRTGHIFPGELFEGIQNLKSNPDFKEVTKIFSDTSGANFSEIKTPEFEFHAKYCTDALKGLKVAIVSPEDLSFGVSRMFGTLSELENIMVTRNIDEAISWLDIPKPESITSE